MSGRTIVVIEDEAAIAGAVAARLRSEGFRVELAATGPSGVELCRRLAPDLVVLDWMLPGFDGIEACRRIQADQPVPVLFLTARDAEADVLVGLGIGADDYLTKPFSPRELVARVHAILRRAARSALAEPPARVEVGPYVLDLDARRVRRDGEEIRVTPTELDLLATLAGRPGRAFSRAELLAEVWGWRAGGSTAHRRLPRGRAAPQARRGRRAHGAGPRLRARRPGVAVLARVPSLKLKLGLVIVLAIVVTLATLLIAAELGLRLRWGAVAAVAVSLACVQLVARGMVSPLRAMARAAEAMARGEHGQRVEVSSRDEVGQLAESFNRMAAELETLDCVRRDFVADAAHELRTPISALRAQLENAADGVEAADPRALLEQVERLGRLTDQLLDLSRLDANAAALAPRTFAVAELLAGCGATVDAPAGLRARGDPDRLRQVVANLVDNAHRHAPGTPVVVRARPAEGGGVRLEVEDRGPGLDAGEAERVFDRFARTDRSRSTSGAGLGLAIARSIVELHGGAIRAEAAAPHGCRMVVELP